MAGKEFDGLMEGVTGSIYDGNEEVSTFKGEIGRAFKGKENRLDLENKVTVVSKKHQATLTCDKIEYLPNQKRVRAIGHVVVKTDSGELQAGDEVLATPDLKQIATPALFKP